MHRLSLAKNTAVPQVTILFRPINAIHFATTDVPQIVPIIINNPRRRRQLQKILIQSTLEGGEFS